MRLILIVIAARWLIATLPLSLLVRQHISNATAILAVVAVAWLLILLNGVAERHLVRRIPPRTIPATDMSLLRVGRRLVDVMIVMVCVFAMLRRLGVNPTPLLAGPRGRRPRGRAGGTETLENLIAGASLIFDQAVRVGDFLQRRQDRGSRRTHRFALDAHPHDGSQPVQRARTARLPT